jgi:hypothetical protein
VVLDPGFHLPEGYEVTVLAPGVEPDLEGPVASERERRNGPGEVRPTAIPPSHSVLQIPSVSLGAPLRPITADDLLGEMLEGRS